MKKWNKERFATIWENLESMIKLRSLRARIFLLILVIGLVPCIVMRHGIVSNYEDMAVEHVMYDKTIRMVNGRFVALLQDDDDFKDLSWVDDAVFYFEKYPELAILGGRDCLDFAIDKQKGRFDILDYDLPTKDIDFCFVPHVNRAPMWLNRSLFLEKLKHIDFDFAPFQFDDVELCLRTWLNGCQVGWYKTGFSSLSAGGMRIWNNAFTQEQCEKNICKLYDLYSDKDVELHRIINTSNNNLGCHG